MSSEWASAGYRLDAFPAACLQESPHQGAERTVSRG